MSQKQKDDLLGAATAYRDRAYAPYSDFKVGAAVLGASGIIYGGCNVENAAYPATRCAEQTAIQKAISEGEHSIVAVAVVADSNDVCVPCGVCRQVINEFGQDAWVLMSNLAGKVETVPLTELLPRPFGPGV